MAELVSILDNIWALLYNYFYNLAGRIGNLLDKVVTEEK